MREPAITSSAFGLALLAHGLLLAVCPAGKPVPRTWSEPITITLAAPAVRQEVVAPAASAKTRPVIEIKNQNQKKPPVVKAAAKEAETPRAVAEPLPRTVPGHERPQPSVRQTTAPPVPETHAEPPPRREVQPPRQWSGLPEYLAGVRTRVEAAREYPAMARQMALQGTVVLRVVIAEDGSLASVQVSASSGHASLDKAAMNAVRRASPFRAPAGFGLGRVSIEIPLVFRLT